MERGMEAMWEKTLGYVTREPYRSRFAACLATLRFRMAVREDNISSREALEKLRQARTVSSETVSALAYAAGWMVILVPGGKSIVRSPRLRLVRRLLARLFHFPL
jgi:hypothetical protein